MTEKRKIGADADFIKYLRQNGGETLKKCYQCATCSVVCELSPQEYAFPRKEMIQASWGLKEKLIADPDIWLCHGCMDCSQQCPRGARPADLMGAIRSYIYRYYAFPRFMGKALSSPKYLPLLFGFAIVMIFLLVLITNAVVYNFDLNFFAVREGIVKYEDFINKLTIEALFIPGNILIFAFAYIGLSNYWKDLSANYIGKKPVYGFWKSVFYVLKDFLVHRKFSKCENNSNRYWGHIYAFYGFIGTMIATGLVVVGEIHHYGSLYEIEILKSISFHLPYPMNLFHPVKILGMLGGIFLFIGLLMFLIRRLKMEEQEGRSTYNDWLFLIVILSVAFTGILIVFLRMSVSIDNVWIAYTFYFIHLVLVFFLLWYMPYSKFAHMIYRFLGLVFLKMHNRENKPQIFSRN